MKQNNKRIKGRISKDNSIQQIRKQSKKKRIISMRSWVSRLNKTKCQLKENSNSNKKKKNLVNHNNSNNINSISSNIRIVNKLLTVEIIISKSKSNRDNNNKSSSKTFKKHNNSNSNSSNTHKLNNNNNLNNNTRNNNNRSIQMKRGISCCLLMSSIRFSTNSRLRLETIKLKKLSLFLVSIF